jgi:hypothetical protein
MSGSISGFLAGFALDMIQTEMLLPTELIIKPGIHVMYHILGGFDKFEKALVLETGRVVIRWR